MTLFKDKYRIESTRIPGYDYSQACAYYVTICTKNRIHYFGSIIENKMVFNEIGYISNKFWLEIPEHCPYAISDEFIIMPNHIHGIIIIQDNKPSDVETLHATSLHQPNATSLHQPNATSLPISSPRTGSLSTVIRSFKSAVTKYCNEKGLSFSWQPRFYEHIIRDDFDLNKIRNYIVNNPHNWDKDEENI